MEIAEAKAHGGPGADKVALSTAALRRLQNELKNLSSQAPDTITAGPVDEDITHWEASFTGPDDTCWEGGLFRLSLKFSGDYPNHPPEVRFLSAMFHPNVYADGRICMDILKSHWSPSTDVLSLVLSIQSLLADPNLDSPANQEAAEMLRSNRTSYEARVRDIVDQSLA